MPTVLVTIKKHPSLVNSESDTRPNSYQVGVDEILFDALEGQGLSLPHGCLSGSCGACRIEVLAGDNNLAPMGAIEKDTVEHLVDQYPGKKIRLSCRAKVIGDVEISTLP